MSSPDSEFPFLRSSHSLADFILSPVDGRPPNMEESRSSALTKPGSCPLMPLEEAQDLLQSGRIEMTRNRIRLAWLDHSTSTCWCTFRGCNFHVRDHFYDSIWPRATVTEHFLADHLNAGPGELRVCRWCDYSHPHSLFDHAEKHMHEMSNLRVASCRNGCGKTWFPIRTKGDDHFEKYCPVRSERPKGHFGRVWAGPDLGFVPVNGDASAARPSPAEQTAVADAPGTISRAHERIFDRTASGHGSQTTRSLHNFGHAAQAPDLAGSRQQCSTPYALSPSDPDYNAFDHYFGLNIVRDHTQHRSPSPSSPSGQSPPRSAAASPSAFDGAILASQSTTPHSPPPPPHIRDSPRPFEGQAHSGSSTPQDAFRVVARRP